GRLVQEGWRKMAAKHGLKFEIAGRAALTYFTLDHIKRRKMLAVNITVLVLHFIQHLTIKDSTAASQGAKDLLYADLGLTKPRHLPILGFVNIDHGYAPLSENETLLVAGMSGSGKTALVQQWTQGPLDAGKVGIWFCEMPEDQMRARDVLRNTRVGSFYKLRKIGRDRPPTLVAQSEEKKMIDAELDRLKAQKVYYFPVHGLTASRMLATCQYVASREGQLDFVALDHIQEFTNTKKVSDSQVVKQSYMEFNGALKKNFPRVVRIVIHHLNKDIQRSYGADSAKMIWPQKSDIAYGGSEYADTAFILIDDNQHLTVHFGLNAHEKLEALRATNLLEYRAFKQRAWLWPVKSRRGPENEVQRLRKIGAHYLFYEVAGEENTGEAEE
ncbi:hypothetical protein LCGC14_1735300, partial [marine sediment metagenome]